MLGAKPITRKINLKVKKKLKTCDNDKSFIEHRYETYCCIFFLDIRISFISNYG